MKRFALVLLSTCLLRAEDVCTLDRQADALFAQLRRNTGSEQAVEQLRGLTTNDIWAASALRPYAMAVCACEQARKNDRPAFDRTVELIRKDYPQSPIPAILGQIAKTEPCVSCPKPQPGCRSCGFTGKCRKCAGTGQIADHELKKSGGSATGQKRIAKLGESTSEMRDRLKSCDVCGGSGACAVCGGKSSSAPCSICNGTRQIQVLTNPGPIQRRLLEAVAVVFAGNEVQRQTLAVSETFAAVDLLSPEKALAALTNAIVKNPRAANLLQARERAVGELQAVAVQKKLVAVKGLSPSEAASLLETVMLANPKASNLAQARAEVNRCRTIVAETIQRHRAFMDSIRTMPNLETARAILFDRIKKETNSDFRREMDVAMVELNQNIRHRNVVFYSVGTVAVLAALWMASRFFR